MSQNSLVLPTTGTVSGLQMTQNTNNALDTLNTQASGGSAPSSPETGQFWHDTTNNILKKRSLDNSTWIPLFYLNESAYLAGPPSLGQISGSANRIVNGAMAIDQVNEGASYSIPTNNNWTYTTDQWRVICSSTGASGVTAQQVTDAPPGFVNSLKVTVGTGGTVGSTDNLQIGQLIEGLNINDLDFGNSSASAVSVSFYVKSSVTGTFSAVLQNAATNRSYITSFSIASAGVWTKITLANIPGDQSGTWPINNIASLNLSITVSCGSGFQTSTLNSWQGALYLAATTQNNSVLGTSGATFQLTGVMLNAGAFCQPYDKRAAQAELAACERYYEKTFPQGVAVAQNAGSTGAFSFIPGSSSFGCSAMFRTPKRTSATVTTYNPSASNSNWHDTTGADRTFIGGSPSDKQFQCYGSGGSTNASTFIHYSANARM
jgi:hypothetical protein